MKTQIKVYDHKGLFKGILDKQTYSSSFEVDCLKNSGQQTLELQVSNKENLITYSDYVEVYANIEGEYKLYYSGVVYRFPEGEETKTIYLNGIYEILVNEQYIAGTYTGTVKSILETMLVNFHSNKIVDTLGIFNSSIFSISLDSENGPIVEVGLDKINCYEFIKKVCEAGAVNFYIRPNGEILIREIPIIKTLNYKKDFKEYSSELSGDDIYNIVTIEGKNNTLTYQNPASIGKYGRIVIDNIQKSELTNDTTLNIFGQNLVDENAREKNEIQITHSIIGFEPGYSINTLNLKDNFQDLIIEKLVLKGNYEILYIDKYINYGKILGNQM